MARDCDKPRVERGSGGGRGGYNRGSGGYRQQNRPARNFGSGANSQPLGARKSENAE